VTEEALVESHAVAPLVVVFEGIEGAGKTTQIGLLEAVLQARGLAVLATGVFRTHYGRVVRCWFMDAERMAQVSLRSQVFLLGSAMNQLVEELGTRSASVILIDRFVYTTMAYHGGGLGMGVAAVEEVYAPVLARLQPDLVIVLDMSPDLIATRRAATDRVEQMDHAFFERVRATYAELAARLPTVVVLDASQSEVAVHEQVLSLVLARLRVRFSQ
jgi:dTMP kinase